MDKKKPHLSHTQIDLYSKCGEAYRRRYIEKHVIPPGVAAVRGTSVHVGAEANYDQKVHTREDLKAGWVAEIAADAFDKTVKYEDVWLNPEEVAAGKKKALGEAKDMTVRLAKVFTEKVAPKYQPAHVEMEHTIPIPAASHDLKVVLDLVTEDGLVQDLKTRTRRSSQEDVDRSTQFTLYDMAYRHKFGKAPEGIVVDELVDGKEPGVNTIPTKRGLEDFGAVVNRMNAVLKGVNAGVFTPATPGGWWCTPKWCGYWATCPYVSKR